MRLFTTLFFFFLVLLLPFSYGVSYSYNFREHFNTSSHNVNSSSLLTLNRSVDYLTMNFNYNGDQGPYYVGDTLNCSGAVCGQVKRDGYLYYNQFGAFREPILNYYRFDEALHFTNSSEIWFTYNGTCESAAQDQYSVGVMFLDSNDNCVLGWEGSPLNDTGAYCEGTLEYDCANPDPISCSGAGTEEKYFTANFSDCSVGFPNSITGIDSMLFFTYARGNFGNDEIYFKDLEFTGFTGSNELPQFNLSTNITDIRLCINETGTLTYGVSELNTYDPENDTIYYAQSTDDFNINMSIDYWERECLAENILDVGMWDLFCTFTIDEQHMSRIEQTRSCEIKDTFFNPNVITYSDVQISEYDFISLAGDYWLVPALQFQNSCVGNKTYRYKPIAPLNRLRYRASFYDLDPGENITLRFENSMFQDILNITIRGYDGNISVYNNTNLLIETAENYDWFGISIADDPDTNETVVGLWVSDTGGPYFSTLSMDTGKVVRYVTVDYSEVTDVKLAGFYISGADVSPSFSTTLPTGITINNPGWYTYTLWITDSYHLGLDEYSFLNQRIKVEICDELFPSKAIDSCDGRIPVLCHVKEKLIGRALKSYLQDQNYYEDGKSILWWIFILMFMGIVAAEFVLLRRISLIAPLFIASLGGFFVAWLIDYSGHMLTFIILMSFSLAGPLMRGITHGR